MATITEIEVAESPNHRDRRHEVRDGLMVEEACMGTYPTEVATILASFLGPYARQGELGRVIVEALYRIDSKTQYRPDISFVSFEKWPKGRRTPDTEPWDIIPDLAIEVISKNDKAIDVMAKVRHYLKAGVRSVWVVYPTLRLVQVFDPSLENQVLTHEDTLGGGDFFPGFELPLVTLFEDDDESDPAA